MAKKKIANPTAIEAKSFEQVLREKIEMIAQARSIFVWYKGRYTTFNESPPEAQVEYVNDILENMAKNFARTYVD